MDGGDVVRILGDLEAILNTDIVLEIKALASSPAPGVPGECAH
jgi:hypothetical protein